jgi:hypothetical protein
VTGTPRRDDLSLLAAAHVALAGLVFLSAAVPGFYASIGLDLAFGAGDPRRPDAAEIGRAMVARGMLGVAAVVVLALILLFAGRCIRERRRYRAVVAVAILALAVVPFGTLLGVWALTVLGQRDVRRQFGRSLARE